MKPEYHIVNVPIDKGGGFGVPFSGANHDHSSDFDMLPPGFFFPKDVVMVDGKIIGKPALSEEYALTGTKVLAFQHNHMFIMQSGDSLKWYNSSAGAWQYVYDTATGAVKTWTSSSEYINMCSYDTVAIIGASGCKALAIVTSTTPPTWGYVYNDSKTQGIVGSDEGRLFICDMSKTIYYSTRYDITTGYNVSGEGEWFNLGDSHHRVIDMMTVNGIFYIFKSSTSDMGFEIFAKKVTYEADQLIDQTQFEIVFITNYGKIPSPHCICEMGGDLYIFAYPHGLLRVRGNSCENLDPPSNLWRGLEHTNAIIVPDNVAKLIMVKFKIGSTTSDDVYAYDVRTGVWTRWEDIDIDCRYRNTEYYWASSTYGVNSIQTLYYLRGGTNITPRIYTTPLNLGFPGYEKFLRRIQVNGRGYKTLTVIGKGKTGGDYETLHTISSIDASGLIELPANQRFEDCIIKIDGYNDLRIESLTIEFFVRRRSSITGSYSSYGMDGTLYGGYASS